MYNVNSLQDKWDRDLTPDKIETEKDNVNVFVESNRNPITNMLKYISENCKGDERTYAKKDGVEIFSSFRLLLVAQVASGFESLVVLNSLVKDNRIKNYKNLGD